MNEWMLRRVTRPALLALHRWTAGVPFPVAEILAWSLGLLLLAALCAAIHRAVRQRGFAPLGRWLKAMGWTVLAAAGLLAALWFPAMAQPVETPSVPAAGQLEWLCGDLIDVLNASPLAFPEPVETLRLAPEAAGLTGCAVKAARYPEWMRAAAVSGLFVPLTGEALVDATSPSPLVPFTAVHELMHLAGIADEGAANVAAWERCLEAGGAFADSARLWALRYAMGLLHTSDVQAWQRALDKIKDPLARVYNDCGGEAASGRKSGAFGLPSLSIIRGDYAALVGWLASNPSGPMGRLSSDLEGQ